MKLPFEEKSKLKKIDILKIIISIIFIIGISVVLAYFLQLKIQKMSEEFIKRIAQEPVIFTSSDDTVVSYNSISENKMVSENKVYTQPNKINFWSLQSINPDIKAWIEIPGTGVNYPILCASTEEGDDYYLRRDYKKNNNNHGSIYIQTGDLPDFSQMVTVIYGHNMKDGTMFGWLHHLSEETTAYENPYMYIYLPDRTIKAQLLACHTTDYSLISNKFNDFSSAQDRMNYIYTFDNKTPLCDLKEMDIVNGKEKLITLSTCTQGGEKRELVQYLIIDEDY